MWRLWLARPEYKLHEIREMSLEDVHLQLWLLDRIDAARSEADERARESAETERAFAGGA